MTRENRSNMVGYDISIVLPVFNQPVTLKIILKALLAQTFSGSYEIIVCDDGSRADSFKEIRDLIDSASIPIRYVWQQDRSHRVGAARNNGIRLANGRLILFLDGDMIPEIDLLEGHWRVQTELGEKSLVAGDRMWRLPDSIEDSADEPIESVLGRLRQGVPSDSQSAIYETRERAHRRKCMEIGKSWRVCFTCNLSMWKADCVVFDEHFVGYGYQDLELAYRLVRDHGYTAHFVEDLRAYHVELPGCVTNALRVKTHEALVEMMRNACYFFDKCPEQDMEDVFYNYPRLVLDSQTNTWSVNPVRPEKGTYDLTVIVMSIREWLKDHSIYPV